MKCYIILDEPASTIASPSEMPDSPKLITMRKSSAFFTNLDSSTTPTPT